MARTFAYVGCRTTRERHAEGTGIGVYDVDACGAWRHLQTFEPLTNPSFLALDDRRGTLYTVHGDGDSVSAFGIEPRTGLLSALGGQPCAGRNPVHLDFTRDGDALAVAGYASGTATLIPLAPDGSLDAAQAPLIFDGERGPHRIEQTSAHPHQIARYVTRRYDTDWHIVPDKGLDTVFAIRWPKDEAPVVHAARAREGAGPRHAAFHPELPLVYVANELDSTVTTWSFDPLTGQLDALHTVSTIPPNHHDPTRAAGIVVSPDGRALYVSNRGHDTIATFQLDRSTGRPRDVHWTPTGGQCPRFLCIGPDGRTLYAANEHSHTIVQFQIDTDGNQPVATGRVIRTGSPVGIIFRTTED
ncbi:lactonase family protein [Paraburkholderia phosphatilytica]|uniref:lactonase family protein n=1 Tax=Paraburkholderia phosphatilytica TaxID=2282883 RepID=UPI000E489B39|nr:lactonase family protein [Paraburkholderia phosphatilytica]